MTATGRLLLVPTPLDFGTDATQAPLTDTVPMGTVAHMARTRHWICENAKSLRAVLKRVQAIVPLECALQELDVHELPRAIHKKGDHGGANHPAFDFAPWLEPARRGIDVGLASEAGLPAVADPGASVVRAAHALGIPVVPLSGPSAVVLAVAASGLNGQQFAFVGYLPTDATERASRLGALEKLAETTGQSQWWIETPYRNPSMLSDMLAQLKPDTRICLAAGLTLPSATVWQGDVARARQHPPAAPNRIPMVFGLGR